MKKKYLAIVLVVCMALSTAACGKEEKNVRGTVVSETKTEQSVAAVESSVEETNAAEKASAEESAVTEGTETADEVSLGSAKNNVYENSFLKIGCQLGNEWTFLTDEEIRANNQIAQDAVGDEYKAALDSADVLNDMMAVKNDQLSNLNIVLEKLNGQAIGVTETEYVELTVDALKGALESIGLTVNGVETGMETFAGQQHAVVNIDASVEGVPFYEKVVVMKVSNYMAVITMSHAMDDDFSEMMDSFYSL